jgi:hypothetical protein
MTIVPIDPKIRLLVEQTKNSGGMRPLTFEEIQLRLHLYNLVYDSELFNDIPPEQQHAVMYPEMISFGDPDRGAMLADLFGELPEPKG